MLSTSRHAEQARFLRCFVSKQTAIVFVGVLDAAERVRSLLNSESVDCSLVSKPFVSLTCVEGAFGPAHREAEVHVPLHALDAARKVMEMNAAIVKEWTGFPLDGAPVEDSESGHSDSRDG